MITLDLDMLNGKIPTVTAVVGCFYREAALFCLDSNGHGTDTVLQVYGTINGDYLLNTSASLDDRAPHSWADTQEATEYGAAALAIVMALAFTEYTTVERSFKGTGFDYWLGGDSQIAGRPFDGRARLEHSGILNGNRSAIDSRMKIKIKQTKASDATGLDAYVAIIEFSKPMAKFVKR